MIEFRFLVTCLSLWDSKTFLFKNNYLAVSGLRYSMQGPFLWSTHSLVVALGLQIVWSGGSVFVAHRLSCSAACGISPLTRD